MVFSSLPFLFIFMPITFILYYIVKGNKAKNIILMIASLIFYAWGEPIYIILMIITSLVNYLSGIIMEKYLRKRKITLITTISISLFLLGFYKYGNFFIENINKLFSLSLKKQNFPLPIGISFYTFQAISYSVDVYRKEVPKEKNFLRFLTYISMFPQLIAGPIVRYQTIQEELQNRKVTFQEVTEGFLRFIKGLGKKVILANNIGLLWDQLRITETPTMMGCWLGIIAFALQIYFDFSGYSDMGIGMGKMLGFNFLENFNDPYMATSITDFWRRWHISLSTFFKDYVYIPLGGNRKGKFKHVRNILIVWLLTGFWHGAAWNFLWWGLYYGILLLIEKFFLKKYLDKLPNMFKHIYALFFILIGWCIFAFDDTKQLLTYLGNMFGQNSVSLINQETLYYLINNKTLLLIGIICSTPLIKNISYQLGKKKNNRTQRISFLITLVTYTLIFIISVSYLVDSAYNPFLYFRF